MIRLNIKTKAKVKLKKLIFNQFIFFLMFDSLEVIFKTVKQNIGLILICYEVKYKIKLTPKVIILII